MLNKILQSTFCTEMSIKKYTTRMNISYITNIISQVNHAIKINIDFS